VAGAEFLVRLGSSVGTSERLKIVRSPVRSRPKPQWTSWLSFKLTENLLDLSFSMMETNVSYYHNMSLKFIMHVGPWKTGSTALQVFLENNRSSLESLGILYPVGNVSSNAHHELPNLVFNKTSRFGNKKIPKDLNLRSIIRGYFEEIDEKRLTTVLVSAESFANFNSENYAEFFNEISHIRDCRFEIIYFDFDPESRLQSHVNTNIACGEHVDSAAIVWLTQFVRDIPLKFEAATKDFKSIVKRIDYSTLQSHDDLFCRFLSKLIPDYESHGDLQWIIPKDRINASLSPKNLEALNQFNRLNNGDRAFDMSLPLVFSDSFPKEFGRLELKKAQLRATSKRKKIILNLISWRLYRLLRRLKSFIRVV